MKKSIDALCAGCRQDTFVQKRSGQAELLGGQATHTSIARRRRSCARTTIQRTIVPRCAYRQRSDPRGFNFKTGDHMEHCSVTHHTWHPARTSKQSTVREEESTHTTNIKHSASCLFDKSDTGKWVSEEAVVESGSVECVTSKNRMPHLRVEETPESRRGETCTCAGGTRSRRKER